MKRIVFIPLLFLVSLLHAQRHLGPGKMNSKVKYNNNCQRNTNYPPAERMKHYPFNLAATVQLISFDGLVAITDSGTIKISGQDPGLVGEAVVPLFIKERVMLTGAQVDSLTDILYNYGYIRRGGSDKTRECYSPRNAIVFIDAEGKAFAFIEICFMCFNTRESDERISLGELCEDKLQMIRQFFGHAGVKFGIEDTSDGISEMKAIEDESLIQI